VSERLRAPWALALAVAVPLSVGYLAWQPPSGDLAAATYRANLFSRVGFTLWDNGWYGGHYLPGYSLLSPALGALLGEQLLLALSAIAVAGLFGLLVAGAFDAAGARVAAALFALGICVELLSGRVAYDLGLAVGLLALVALRRGHRWVAVGLAALTSVASPVAGAFLALAGLAVVLAATPRRAGVRARAPARGGVAAVEPQPHATATSTSARSTSALTAGAPHAGQRAGAAVTAAALAPIVLLTAAFPEGGYEPFAPSVFWPGVAGVVAIALLLPRLGGELRPAVQATLRWGAWLYAAALVGSYVLQTPVGSNAARLGELVATPLVGGALWQRHRLALALLAPVLLYWQLETPLNDYAALAGDPSVSASYYAPLVAKLNELAHGAALRVEVPQTGAHWESVYVPQTGTIELARGWERQLDTRYAPLFYRSRLTARAYQAWLSENAVSYVALPDVRLDYSATAEGALIERGLPYLREVWRAAHWRLFVVRGAQALAQRPAVLTRLGPDSFTLSAPTRGTFEVRVRFTPYWMLLDGAGCVSQAPAGWTLIQTRGAGTIRVGIDFSPARIFASGPRCRG
jgi:hypothetical protein